MGTLYADASLNTTLKQIDINATAVDTDDRRTLINGYVSPQRSDIKLDITAQRHVSNFLKVSAQASCATLTAKQLVPYALQDH